jgi:hypothetical protein
VVVGVLVLGAGAAFGIPKLLESDTPTTAKKSTGTATKDGKAAPAPKPAVKPGQVTVSVLNGTSVPGLAAQVGDRVENEGFILGNVTNASGAQRSASVVLYAPGHVRDARAASRRLDIPNVEAIDPESQALAGDATVVVIVGQDQTR